MASHLEQFNQRERKLLAAYWWQRAEGEYTSWKAFGQIRRDLSSLGAHPNTMALAHRAVDDERKHAIWCQEWSERFGGKKQPLAARDETPLRFEGAPDSVQPLLRVAFCCMTETMGCFVLRAQRPHILVEEIKRLNQLHLADELQHSRVGWSFFASMSEAQRNVLRRYTRSLGKLLLEVASAGTETDEENLLGGGYFTKALLRKAGEDALQHVIEPGMRNLRLGEAA